MTEPGRRRVRVDRLDVPSEPRRRIPRVHYDPEAFGIVSETVARFLGTARFLVLQTVLIIIWVVYNFVIPPFGRFDPYPFIFLTLVLSLQASYAAPLILLAQNRQDDRDRVNLEQDRSRADQTRADMEFLAREIAGLRATLGEVATRDYLRSELQRLAEGLAEGRNEARASRDEREG